MTIKYHTDLIQGSDAWLNARLGLLTASEVCRIMTPTLKVANNDKTRSHAYELAFQRISGFVEPNYISDSMLRGREDEFYARQTYHDNFAPVTETGFITNDKWGFTLGYSPDGLVGDDGLIECKSRAGRFQIQTIAGQEVPEEYVLQLQTGLLVSEREWIDFVSYSGGLPIFVMRVEPNPEIQEAIIAAACAFEERLADVEQDYRSSLAAMRKVINTERRIDAEMYI